MKLKLTIAALLAATSAPVFAQAQPSAASTAHEAAAARVVDKLWPLGTYRRMMDGTMSKMMDGLMQSMFGMKGATVIPPRSKDAVGRDIGDKTIAELAEEKDPHFRERMKISMDVMMREMIPLVEKIEPSVRESLTRIYARDYTDAQLTELDAFLATPTGQQFGHQWVMTFVDPEMTASMAKMAPTLMQAMPDIIKKIEAATAHLPPPPKQND